jgi:hypothetical protein
VEWLVVGCWVLITTVAVAGTNYLLVLRLAEGRLLLLLRLVISVIIVSPTLNLLVVPSRLHAAHGMIVGLATIIVPAMGCREGERLAREQLARQRENKLKGQTKVHRLDSPHWLPSRWATQCHGRSDVPGDGHPEGESKAMWSRAKTILAHHQFRRQARISLFLGLYFVFLLIQHPNWAMVSGCTVAAVGFLLNRLVLALNGGFMLVALAEELIPPQHRDCYKPIDNESRVVFLSDWLPLGHGRLTSIGDVVATTGFALIILGFIS